MRKNQISLKYTEQRGAATLLFIIMAAFALMSVTARVLNAVSSAQKSFYTEHIATQAELTAWTGVNVLAAAVATLPTTTTLESLTPNSIVTLSNVPGVSALYVGPDESNTYAVFQVTGSSAGANSVLKVVYSLPITAQGGTGGGSSSSISGFVNGMTLRGNTTLQGNVTYTGSVPTNLSVVGGSLTLSGSVSGLNEVCATGDVTVNSAISVNAICANGNVVLNGAASASSISAIGSVTLSGGAVSTIGTINSNSTVTLSGGSASADTINSTGNVSVSGGSATASIINTQGNINWTSSRTATLLNANGTVNYSTSASPAMTNINSIGDVRLSTAQNVSTKGSVFLTGYYGQGIGGILNSQGKLSWNSNGNKVNSGTVRSVQSTPLPPSINVNINSGHTVSITPVTVNSIPIYNPNTPTVDANALKASANFLFNGVDSNNNPIVEVQNISGISNGNYFIAKNSSGLSNYLCASVSGTNCSSSTLMKICQGYSDRNSCFSYSNSSGWSINGTTMLPSVLWFNGNVTVGNGTWVNAVLASGNVTTSGSAKMYAPNYVSSGYTCQGAADTTHGLSTGVSSHGISSANYATQLCSGSPPTLNGAAIGNIAILAGSYNSGVFSGGNIALGASNNIYGSVLAGQYLSTSGSTTVSGLLFSGGQNSSATGGNSQSGSTTITTTGGSASYDSVNIPCMANCSNNTTTNPPSSTNNIIWVGPA